MKKILYLLAGLMFLTSLSFTAASATSYSEDLTNSLSTGAFSASSTYSGSYGPARAFDNVWNENNGGWQSTVANYGSAWISVDFGTPQPIGKINIQNDAVLSYTHGIKNFKVQASDDNSDWTDQFTGEALANGTTQSFTWSPDDSYKYWRVLITTNSAGSGYIAVSEMEMFAVTGPDAPSGLVLTADNAQVNMSWNEVSDAESYTIKRSETSGGPYTTVQTGVTDTTYTDTTVTNGVLYYYIVTAVSGGVESSPSNEESVTIDSTSRFLLTIYLDNGQIKEYDLSQTELDDYLSWFDDRSGGTGPAKYGFAKAWNQGPFKTRTEYVIFSKIDNFDVDEYEPVTEE